MPRRILCLPKSRVRIDEGHWKPPLDLGAMLSLCVWHEKDAAEHDEDLRQVIPYMIIMSPQGRILAYERSGSEGRLHGKWSIGFGGHIEEADRDFYTGTMRELKEELGLRDEAFFESDQLDDYILCYKTPVDRVHMGVPFLLTVDEDEPSPSSEIPEPHWKTVDELTDLSLEGRLEDWSEIAFDRVAMTAARRAAKSEKD